MVDGFWKIQGCGLILEEHMDCALLNGGDLVLKKGKKSNGGDLRRLKVMDCVSFNS